jgi:hypothetical protein
VSRDLVGIARENAAGEASRSLTFRPSLRYEPPSRFIPCLKAAALDATP